MQSRALFSLLLCGALSGCSVKVTGIYTSMAARPNGGNVVGVEMTLVRGDADQYFAVIQCANEAPGKPAVVDAKIDQTAAGIMVELSPSRDIGNHCPRVPFKGSISPSGISGAFAGHAPLILKRGSSYWQ